MCLALVGMARCAVPARVVAGGMKYSSDTAIRNNCAAARGADIAARCPYPAKHVPRKTRCWQNSNAIGRAVKFLTDNGATCSVCSKFRPARSTGRISTNGLANWGSRTFCLAHWKKPDFLNQGVESVRRSEFISQLASSGKCAVLTFRRQTVCRALIGAFPSSVPQKPGVS